MIQEHYTPDFLLSEKNYRIRPLIVSDDLAKELNEMTDKFARYDRLEKYLYGNLQRFFTHIGFAFDKEVHFLKVTVTELKAFNRSMPVFHGHKKTAFEVAFKVNFRLPQTLRIGQSTALGFGKVRHR